MIDILHATALAFPTAAAIDDGRSVLDYSALLREVDGFGKRLSARGIGRGDRVGVRMPSGTADLYVAILAILSVGAAYVPVDVDDPDDRAELAWSEAGVCAVIETDRAVRLRPVPPRRAGSQPPDPSDGAWIIFTSGSTGKPKAVAVSHRSAAAFVDAEACLFLAGQNGRGARRLARAAADLSGVHCANARGPMAHRPAAWDPAADHRRRSVSDRAGTRDFLFLAVLIALPWGPGRGAPAYREEIRGLTVTAAQLKLERQVSARLAVAEERQRLGRELQDVIAQAVSRMVIAAAGADQALSSAPDRARTYLRAVQETGRDLITELRRTLHRLRTDHPASPPAAVPVAAPAAGYRSAPLPRWLAWIRLVLSAALVLSFTAVALLARWPDPTAEATIDLAAVACLSVTLCLRMPRTALLPAVAAALSAVSYLGLVPVALVTGKADQVVSLLALFAVAGWAGFAVRIHRRRPAMLQALSARLARERDAWTRLAVMEERSRVARELHDSVAHAVSIMVLQAGAAEQMLSAAPDRARNAVLAVEECGRQALYEMKQLFGVLHPDEDANPDAPQPSLADLDRLIARARQVGLPVDLQIRGKPNALPTSIDLSAYRIVQEGLTNAVKHAGRARTTVTIDYSGDAVAMEIRNTGPVRPSTQDGTRHGLLGIRERVDMYGGDLKHGPQPGGGYAVRARLPLDSARA